jgi:uncharacterized protein (DUF2062 family)
MIPFTLVVGFLVAGAYVFGLYQPLLSVKETLGAIGAGVLVGVGAAYFFPALGPSHIVAKAFGAEIDLATAGRVFSFLAGLMITCLLWMALRRTKPAQGA